jgi:hypothetical protein
MSDTNYAVHTQTCTYLLDEEGVCRWIVSATGMVPPDVRLCVGAQFVACIDLRVGGALVGELRIGASALFVRIDAETGRAVLLRTRVIEQIEFRPDVDPRARRVSLHEPDGGDTVDLPAPGTQRLGDGSEGGAGGEEDEVYEIDADDLVMYGDVERTVTLTMPLFRPEMQSQPVGPPASWKPLGTASRRGTSGNHGK